MGQIETLFYEHPEEEFYLRQIAKKTGIPKTTAERTLKKLREERLITRRDAKPVPLYTANLTPAYRLAKQQWIVKNIVSSGLIDFLAKETQARAIVLFGSCAKGEFNRDSDIDLFVQAEKKPLSLKKFRLGHDIELFFEPKLENLSKELLNNLINGLTLYGHLRL